MEDAPENGKESPHSAHANGMNERNVCFIIIDKLTIFDTVDWCGRVVPMIPTGICEL
jgi:hypothetical protein